VAKTAQHHTLTGHSAMLSGRFSPAPVAEIQSPITMVTAYNHTRWLMVGRSHFGFHYVVFSVVIEQECNIFY